MPEIGIDWLLISFGVVLELLEDFDGSMIYRKRANAPETIAWYRNGRDWLRVASIRNDTQQTEVGIFPYIMNQANTNQQTTDIRYPNVEVSPKYAGYLFVLFTCHLETAASRIYKSG